MSTEAGSARSQVNLLSSRSLFWTALLGFAALASGYLVAREKVLLLAALLCAVAYTVLLIQSPRSAFLFWLLLAPVGERLVRFPMEEALITFDRLGIGIVFFYLLFRVLITKRKDLLPVQTPEKTMVLFGGWVLTSSILFSKAGLGAIRYATDTLLLSFMAYYTAKNLFRTEKEFNTLTAVLACVALYLCAMGLFEWATHYDLIPYKIRMTIAGFAVKSNGPFRHHYAFALVQIVLFFVLVHRAVMAEWRTAGGKAPTRLFYGAAFLGLALNIYSNLSRGRWLGFLAGLSLWSFLHRSPGRGRLLKVGSVLFVIASCVVGFMYLKQTQLFKQRIENRENVYARLAAWNAVVDQVKAHPILGVGYRNLQDILERKRTLYKYRGVKGLESSHNSYLQFLAELGLIGFSLLALMLWSLLRMCLSYRALAHATLLDRAWQACILSIFVGFLLPAFFANTLYSIEYPNKLFFTVLGATAGRLWALKTEGAAEKAVRASPVA